MKLTASSKTARSYSNCGTSVEVVPVVTIQWPTNLGVVNYFHKTANLVEGDWSADKIDWTKTQNWLIPLKNEFCLKKLAKEAISVYESYIEHDGKVLKVQLYDPETHQLLAEAEA